MSEVTQSCPTLCDPMDCSPPGSSVHGILQARVLEWGAISFSIIPVDGNQNHGPPQCTAPPRRPRNRMQHGTTVKAQVLESESLATNLSYSSVG